MPGFGESVETVRRLTSYTFFLKSWVGVFCLTDVLGSDAGGGSRVAVDLATAQDLRAGTLFLLPWGTL